MGAASRKESPTPTQTSLASIALMRRSLRLGSLASPRLASPLPSAFPARSLARWAGPGRAPRSRSRPLPVCVSCKSACSLLSKRCHRPLAAGAPRLLPRAPPPPPPGALPAPRLREGAGPPPPGAEHAHVGDRGQRRPRLERAGPRAAPTSAWRAPGGSRGKEAARGAPRRGTHTQEARLECGPERVRFEA